MFYSNDTIEDVRQANEIVSVVSSYIRLQKRGNSYFGLCPFHTEKSPSFSVSPDRQIYHCFGCGESGNVFTFIMKTENFSFTETIRFLAERVGYVLPRARDDKYDEKLNYKNRLLKINLEAARFFYRNLLKSDVALSYLKKRCIKKDTKRIFGLGYSKNNLYRYLYDLGFKKNELIDSGLFVSRAGKICDRFFERLMFPIFDIYGKIIGFGGRSLNDSKPKYLNSPETILFSKSSCLYNFNLACKSKSKKLILSEGYMDTISLYQAGFKNTAAVLGTALCRKHVQLIKNHFDSVILLFDNDLAGVKATLRAISVLDSVGMGIDVKVLQTPHAKDPDEYIKKYGCDSFADLIGHAVDSVKFRLLIEKSKYNLRNNLDKVKFTKVAVQIISELKDTIQKEIYVREISDMLGISYETINHELERYKANFEIIEVPKRNLKHKNNANNIVEKAQSNLINILVKRQDFCREIKKYIQPEELTGVCKNLLEVLFSAEDNKSKINAADLISNFDDPQKQSIIANILSQDVAYENYEKALLDIIKIIKKNNINKKMSETTDVYLLKQMLEEKKLIDDIQIFSSSNKS